MGGGGGGPTRIDNLDSLLKKASTELERGLNEHVDDRQIILVCYTLEDTSDINKIKVLSKDASLNLDFDELSLRVAFDNERARFIKKKILEKITRYSSLIVHISEYTNTSRWIKWQVEQGKSAGKNIFGAFCGVKQPRRPEFLDSSIEIMPWEKLIGELKDT